MLQFFSRLLKFLEIPRTEIVVGGLCIITGEEAGGANFFPGGFSVGDKVVPMVSRGRLVEIGVFWIGV